MSRSQDEEDNAYEHEASERIRIAYAQKNPRLLYLLDKIPWMWWRKRVAWLRWRLWPVDLPVGYALIWQMDGVLIPENYMHWYRRRQFHRRRRRERLERLGRFTPAFVPWLSLVVAVAALTVAILR